MQWFKCAFEEASLMEAEEELGQAGAFQVMKVIRNALALDVKRLDEKIVARMANVKIDRARRLLPYAERFLKSTLKLYKNVQESELISENLPESYEILENVSDFNTSNPYGSTRDLDKSRKELEKEKNIPSDIKKKKTTPVEEPQQYQELAAWFYDELLKRKPRTDKPNQNSWAKDLRLTCETDNRSIEEIKKALIWAHDVDSFWGRVCLSPDSLRRNWVKIWAAIDTKPKQPYQIHSTALPGNQITPAHLRQSGVIDIS